MKKKKETSKLKREWERTQPRGGFVLSLTYTY